MPPFRRWAALAVLALGGACTLEAPVLDYSGLPCGGPADCPSPWSCTNGFCASHPTSTSGGHGGSSGGSSSGSGGTSTGGVVLTAAAPALIAIGRAHACAIADGGVSCWGNDDVGQLGGGSLTSSWVPTPVSSLTRAVTAVAAGGDQSCAIEGGGVVCWGDQSAGSPFENDSYSLTPAYVDTTDLYQGVTSLAVGSVHACAVNGGSVYCWGGNADGQLGVGTLNPSETPLVLSGLNAAAVAVGAGDFHTCAIVSGGRVACWGNDQSGQLGLGQAGPPQQTPQAVPGLSGVLALAAGTAHTCAVTTAGAVLCWGANDRGQLGTPFETASGSATPVPVQGLSAPADGIAAGGSHTCAVAVGGAVYCWGDDGDGELGDGADGGFSSSAVQVQGLPGAAIAVGAGQASSCAELDGGAVYCWGYGGEGQLGQGTVVNAPTPVPLAASAPAPAVDAGLTGVVAIGGGVGAMFAVTGNGSLLAWGQNAAGQLGNGSNQASAVPVEAVPSLGEPVTQVSAGTDHACAVTAAGNVFCWGANDVGQLGNGQTAASFTPSRVALPVAATAVACGGSHSCALADGGLYCWGENPWGELGNGTNTASPTPVPVTGLSSGVLSVAAALNVTCAILTRGDLQCWGADPDGLLGDGNGAVVAAGLDPSAVPAQVTRLTSGVAQVSIGSTHGCALTTDGGVLCWGQNFFGDLGDGNTDAQSAPIQVTGLHSGIGAIAVGTRHACALTVDAGAVLCWGLGAEGQMGNGASIEKNLQPAASVSGLSGASALAAGNDVTCALVGGAVDCWGYGGEGALGNGGLANALVPGPVAAP